MWNWLNCEFHQVRLLFFILYDNGVEMNQSKVGVITFCLQLNMENNSLVSNFLKVFYLVAVLLKSLLWDKLKILKWNTETQQALETFKWRFSIALILCHTVLKMQFLWVPQKAVLGQFSHSLLNCTPVLTFPEYWHRPKYVTLWGIKNA